MKPLLVLFLFLGILGAIAALVKLILAALGLVAGILCMGAMLSTVAK